jgi:tetratricopeptide (TPR) repeat protein
VRSRSGSRRAGTWALLITATVGLALVLAAAIASAAQILPSPGSLTTPSVSVPQATVPPAGTPTVSAPPLSAPSLSTPSLPTPAGTVPSVSIPQATAPSVSTTNSSTPRSGVSGASRQSAASLGRQAATEPARLTDTASGSDSTGPPSAFSASEAAGGEPGSASTALSLPAERARAVSGAGDFKPPNKNASASNWTRYLRRLVGTLRGCLSSLTPHAQRILGWRTGEGASHAQSEVQVARRLGTNLTRVRHLESDAATALRLSAATGGCGRAPVSASGRSSEIAAASTRAIQDLASRPRADQAGTRPQTAQGRGDPDVRTAARTGRSKQRLRPTIRIENSSLPTLANSKSGFPLLLIVLVVVLAGASTLLLLRRSLVPSYVDAARRRRLGRSSRRGALGSGPSTQVQSLGAGDPQWRIASDPAATSPAAPVVAGGGMAPVPRDDTDRALERGMDLAEQGDLAGAADAFREADNAGDATAATNLGVVLEDQGDFDGALAAYRRADARRDGAGTFNLAALLEERGDLPGAIAAYWRADARGDPAAPAHLGAILEVRGDIDAALTAYRRADARGDAGGAFGLGQLLEELGDAPGARAAFSRADDRGDAGGALNLGGLMQAEGSTQEALEAFLRAEQRGEPGGATRAGLLLERSGNVQAALDAFRRAVERGDVEASVHLGLLLAERGDLRGALAAFARADEEGDATGAFNYGVLMVEHGETGAAIAALQRAEERGSDEVAKSARALLAELRGGVRVD